MFGNLGEMANLLKKAKDIQKNMAAMKEEMAEELLESFVKEMIDLGFSKEELIKIIEARLEKES